MYNHIVVPMALDQGLSPQTLEVAHALLAPGGKITALHVYEAPQGAVSAYLDEDAVKLAYETAGKRLKEKTADAKGVTPVSPCCMGGQVPAATLDNPHLGQCGILFNSTGGGGGRRVLGATPSQT